MITILAIHSLPLFFQKNQTITSPYLLIIRESLFLSAVSPYISSAGFRVMLVAQNMLDDPDNMKVLHANDMVQTAFILTGQGNILMDD